MKHFRIFILLLLAVLLPIRGAVAAAMMCPAGSGTGTAVVVAEGGHHGMHATAGAHAGHSASHHDAGPAEASDAHPAACHFCATGCCMACIVGIFPPMAQPDLTASVAFPPLTAPVPAFQSDGPERPPRTT